MDLVVLDFLHSLQYFVGRDLAQESQMLVLQVHIGLRFLFVSARHAIIFDTILDPVVLHGEHGVEIFELVLVVSADAFHEFLVLVFEVHIDEVQSHLGAHVDETSEVDQNLLLEQVFPVRGLLVRVSFLGLQLRQNYFDPIENSHDRFPAGGVLFDFHAVHEELQTLHIVLLLFEELDPQVIESSVLSFANEVFNFVIFEWLTKIKKLDERVFTDVEVLVFIERLNRC